MQLKSVSSRANPAFIRMTQRDAMTWARSSDFVKQSSSITHACQRLLCHASKILLFLLLVPSDDHRHLLYKWEQDYLVVSQLAINRP